MENIALYDQEADEMFDLCVSQEDARRTQSDMVFATMLLEEARKRRNPGSSEVDMPKDASPDEGTLIRWSGSCILLLLETYREYEGRLESGKCSQKRLWEEIAGVISRKGHTVTGAQCSSKLRSLKKTYKAIKDHNSKSGNDRRTWQYLEIMDSIFAKRAWCSPVATASSSGITKDDQSNGSSEVCASKSNPTSPRPNVGFLLQKRLRQKEEHEASRKRRHEERMVMEEKFLDVLKKIAEK